MIADAEKNKMRRASLLLLIILVLFPNTGTSQSRILTTYAGTDNVFTGDGLPAPSVSLGRVVSVRLDPQGRPVFTARLPAVAQDVAQTVPHLGGVVGNDRAELIA